jgi:tetratricopeptide (TPR) repeat protein
MAHLPARQQTLRAAIGWSYGLLDPAEQTLFARLGVFVGGCTLEAAAAGVGEEGTRAGLDSLVGKSLMRQRTDSDGSPRYVMMRIIREYALEELGYRGEAETTQERYHAYFVELIEQAEPELRGPQQAAWVARLNDEHTNIRAVLYRALTGGDPTVALRMAGALWRFWDRQSYLSEGRSWMEATLAANPDDPATARWRTKVLNGAGNLAWSGGDYASAERYHLQNLALRRSLGDLQGVAGTLNNLGIVAMEQGKYAEARPFFEESMQIGRDTNDQGMLATVLNNLGRVARYEGDYDAAETYQQESLALRREQGDISGLAYSLYNLSQLAQLRGEWDRAAALYVESLDMMGQAADQTILAMGIEGLARTWGRAGRLEEAVQLLGAATTLRETIGSPLYAAEQADYDADVASIRAQLAPEAWDAAWERGQRLNAAGAVAYAHEVAARA